MAANQLHGIEFSPTHLREVGDGAADERVAVADIRRCRLAYGSISARPRLQFAIGAGLVLSFVLFIARSSLIVAGGGRAGLKIEVGLFALFLIGAWLVWDACKKVYYLEIDTARGIRKLRILARGVAELDELRSAAAKHSGLTV